MRVVFLVVGAVFVSSCSGADLTAPSSQSSVVSAGRVSGTVYDSIGRPVSGARVEILDGAQRGVGVLTDQEGRYTLESGGPILIRASKDGYRDYTMRINGGQLKGFFRLDSANGSVNLTGNYAITFTADSACTSIPGYARRRSFDATSSGGSATLLVSLGGGSYGGSGPRGYFNNVLYAGVFENTLRLYLSDPPMFERFPQGSYLVVWGEAEGSVAELPATVPISGEFVYCADGASVDEPKCAVTEVRCQSSKHQLTIARR